MDPTDIVAILFGCLLAVFYAWMCCKDNEDRNFETEEEEAPPPAVTVPSAPPVPVDQATFVNTAFQIEENEDAPKENHDLPPAYEDIFVDSRL